MSGFTICTNSEANCAFLCCLYWIVTSIIDLKTNASAFIESILGLNQLWTIFNNPTRSLMATTFLIGSGHKDDVTLESYTASFEKQHGHCFHGYHMLHVERATTINKTIVNIARKWAMRPLLRFHCDDIGMRHQQDRRRGSISPEPGDECATIATWPHYFSR